MKIQKIQILEINQNRAEIMLPIGAKHMKTTIYSDGFYSYFLVPSIEVNSEPVVVEVLKFSDEVTDKHEFLDVVEANTAEGNIMVFPIFLKRQ